MEAEANGQEIPDDYYSSRNGKLLGPDNSSANGFEYQVYFVLDIKNAKITSLKGHTGSYNRSSIFTLPAHTIGVQYFGIGEVI